MEPSTELTDAGENLYETNCVTCHGELGHGDGPAGNNINPRPRNFTGTEGWTNGLDMPNIFNTLSKGIPGTSMASFDYLTKRERMALVQYVQSLGGYAGRAGSPEAMKALSEELAAPGENTNNRIPVSMAIARLESEFVSPAPLVISTDDRSPGAGILRRAVTDASRVVLTLNASGSWRTGPEALARSILSNTPGNGFSTNIAALKPTEWQALYDELLKRINGR